MDYKIEKVESIEDLKTQIESMVTNDTYYMPESFYYKYIKIDFSKDYGYSWVLGANYSVTKSVTTTFPMVGYTNNVKFFKTEVNAKRNLIKRFEKHKSLYFPC